jgi:hypothetical protein
MTLKSGKSRRFYDWRLLAQCVPRAWLLSSRRRTPKQRETPGGFSYQL